MLGEVIIVIVAVIIFCFAAAYEEAMEEFNHYQELAKKRREAESAEAENMINLD